jgi:hydrophobe/amphiphile efflux-1 (HAE1) family protein
MGRFFIARPIFAIVLSVVVLIVGGISYLSLPVAEYPEIAPPVVTVRAQYPGASAETIASTVAAPLEQEINGVENMIYMYSQSTGDGRMTLRVSFKLGTDLDMAQVLVQNRVAVAQPRLPEEVRRVGVTTRKESPDLLMVVNLFSPDGSRDALYISNYVYLRLRDVLARLDGVGDIQVFGGEEYSMRVWLDPDRMAELDLTADDVVAAVRAQNVQVAGGQLGQPPVETNRAFQPNLTLLGRLEDSGQFERIIVKAGANGRVVMLRDVARIELGARTYNTLSYLGRDNAVAIPISQRPGSNALGTARRVEEAMHTLSEEFPPGLAYGIVYNPTEFVSESVSELITAIRDAVLLVVAVVLVFLQRWRAALVPVIAIPVSLVGTFAVMAALGYTVNNLTLFGLVLAVGIVVDDAIVVVENVERHLSEGLSPAEAARRTMDEVSGALVAIALVLAAVFIPTAFIEGISGQFYRQFAVTIAVATAISCFCSLTLSPALSALLLRGHGEEHRGRREGRFAALGRAVTQPLAWFFGVFNRAFDALGRGYGRLVRFLVGGWGPSLAMLALYAGLIGLAAWGFTRVPTGFIPAQDRGYVIVALQLPGGASLARTDEVLREVRDIALGTPGISNVVSFAGFSGATQTISSSTGAMFPVLAPFEERLEHGLTAAVVTADLRRRLSAVQDAFVLVIPPPPVPGIGTGGGFAMRVQDRAGLGVKALEDAAQELIGRLNQTPGLVAVFTPFSAAVPQVYLEVDRTKAQMLGVPVTNVFSTLEAYLGSAYVNDFNLFGRVYRVTAQADGQYRLDREQIPRLRTRNAAGQMVPIGSFVEFRDVVGTDRMPRYNLYPAIEVNGDSAPGFSTGQVIAAVEKAARETLPQGIGFEWTDLSYQQTTAGNTALYIFPLCVLFVFLVLAAQYESWSLPIAIILIVPMCLLSAIGGVAWMGMDNNILTQIGFVVLVGLASKNAILIVEVAKQREEECGNDPVEAVVQACRLRLRPILMTSFAFILGVVPLMTAAGAGAEMRAAIGTAVFFGMLGVTAFGLLFTPVFYVAIRRLAGGAGPRGREAGPSTAASPAE